MLDGLAVFTLALFMDAMWVVYLRAVEGNRALSAALWSAALLTASWLGATLVVASPQSLAFAAAGAFTGTYVQMKRGGP